MNWVIWISNDEQSEVIGVASTYFRALNSVAHLVDISRKNQQHNRDMSVVLSIDYHNEIILIPFVVDDKLANFNAEAYGLEGQLG